MPFPLYFFTPGPCDLPQGLHYSISFFSVEYGLMSQVYIIRYRDCGEWDVDKLSLGLSDSTLML